MLTLQESIAFSHPQIAMGTKRFTGEIPLQEHENFLKAHHVQVFEK